MDDMFTSRLAPTFMKCGHSIHSKCLNDYSRTNIMCPICRKSICDPIVFEAQYDQMIAEMQMPEEYKDQKMNVLCNDCNKKSEVPFHIVGGKCEHCRSYNTSRVGGD